MSEAPLTLSVRRVTSGASVIDVAGDMTAFAENALMRAYTEASPVGVRAIIMNFSCLEYMNSSGIGLLVTLLIRINRQKQHLLVYGLSDHYKHIFELTRLDEAIHTYDTEAAAVAAANRLP